MESHARALRRKGDTGVLLCAFATLREVLVSVVAVSVALVARPAVAADVRVDTVLSDLHQPCGVVVRPGGTADRYEVFIAESGAGRVLRWSSAAPKEASDVVTGFTSQGAVDLDHQRGPLALAFLDPGLLVVGATGDGDGRILRAYELPEDDKSLSAADANEATPGGQESGAAACIGIARSRVNEFVPDMLLLVVRGTDNRNELLKSRVQAGVVGVPKSFGPADSAHEPRAATISPSGRFVVGDSDGRLEFHSPIDGEVELAMPTGLKQLVALAYSPTSGNLFAADLAGGIHRIDDASEPGSPACRAVKVADVSRPTALAFAPDGSLYVVTFGDGDGNGTLTVLSGNL
jgi:DNA-binding beta-propeller fold protein YncE